MEVGSLQDAPCSSSAAAAESGRLHPGASAWPAPRPSSRSTSTAPPGGPADGTIAPRSPPGGPCRQTPSAKVLLSRWQLSQVALLLFYIVFYSSCKTLSITATILFTLNLLNTLVTFTHPPDRSRISLFQGNSTQHARYRRILILFCRFLVESVVIPSIREPQNWFSGLENVTSASVGQMGVISISAALSL